MAKLAEIEMDTLYDQWFDINSRFFDDSEELQIVKSMGAYAQMWNKTIEATGFGLPEKPPVLLRDERINLLAERYIDPDLWKQCVARFKAAPTSNTHTFLFNRRGKQPKAGGCLIGFTLLRRSARHYDLMMTARAQECTMALLADIYFLHHCLKRLEKELKIKFDLDRMHIRWHMGIAYQTRPFAPVYAFEAYGAKGLKKWMRSKSRNEWERMMQYWTNQMMNWDKNPKVTAANKTWGKRLALWCK